MRQPARGRQADGARRVDGTRLSPADAKLMPPQCAHGGQQNLEAIAVAAATIDDSRRLDQAVELGNARIDQINGA